MLRTICSEMSRDSAALPNPRLNPVQKNSPPSLDLHPNPPCNTTARLSATLFTFLIPASVKRLAWGVPACFSSPHASNGGGIF